MFGQTLSAALVAGLLGLTQVSANPIARPNFPGELLSTRSLESNGSCPFNPNSTLHKRGCNYDLQCGSYDIMLGGKIGEGSYGKVYTGDAYRSGRFVGRVAVKKCNTADCLDGAEAQRAVSGSAAIATMYTSCRSGGKYYTVAELITGGDMLQWETRGKYRHNGQRVSDHFNDIAGGVAYMASKGWAHRDLKPENIMMTSDGLPKIIDFDFATHKSSSSRGCGTPEYMAPEVLASRTYDPTRADAWSLGVILFEMVMNRTPWDDVNSPRARDILSCKTTVDAASMLVREFNYQLPTRLAYLLARIFAWEKDRISSRTIFNDFKNLKPEDLVKKSPRSNVVQSEVEEEGRERKLAVDFGGEDA